jgi:3-oxoacyl-[acyl-carrier protein] reductase
VITGNAWAPLSLARSAIQYVPSGGRIIFISSGSSKFPGGDPFISYSASKAALDTISRNLAVAWGVKYGVTVNSISVGPTATDAMKEAVENGGPAFEEMISNVTLLKRIAHPQEVADIVAFVASPGASWITGMPSS